MSCSSNKYENDLPQVSMNVIATGDEKLTGKGLAETVHIYSLPMV